MLADEADLSTQELVEQFLGAVRLGLLRDAARIAWPAVVAEEMKLALQDAELTLPIRAQLDLMWFSYALTLRLGLRLDPEGTAWSVYGQKATHERRCGPEAAFSRIKREWGYEERADLAIFTERSGREWPLVTTESEAAHWYSLEDDDDNDYAWDFYKLFSNRSPLCLMVALVRGHDGRTASDRIHMLAETLEQAVYQQYRHLLDPGQTIVVVLVPASGTGRALVGTAVNPGLMHWEPWEQASTGQ